jgi:hypothetical protein
MRLLLRYLSGSVAALALISCNASKEIEIAYDCEGSGVLISESELRWNALTFRFREEVGVFRVYEYKGSGVVFNRALSTLVWKNLQTDEVILIKKCEKV